MVERQVFHDRDLEVLIDNFKKYRKVRKALLKTLGCVDSNRDPLAEFSEKLAAHLLNASRAKSRVQKGFDLIGPNGEKIEVKYLTNPSGRWINWHVVNFNELRDKYALVYFEDLFPKAMFVFRKQGLKNLCKALGKRHANTESTLQFTKTNYDDIISNPEKFKKLGVNLFRLNS